MSRPATTLLILVLLAPGCATGRPLREDQGPASRFVKEHLVIHGRPDLATVRSLVRALTDRRLFTRVDRRRMARWHREPAAFTAWQARFRRLTLRLEELVTRAAREPLGAGEAKERSRLAQTTLIMGRREAAWLRVYAGARPGDYPFLLTPEDALELRVIDGCTSAARLFCLLARTAGLRVRPLDAANLDMLQRIWRPGQERLPGGVNGHKMALVRLQDRWHLVNINRFDPAAHPPYEIFTRVGGEPVDPATLAGKVIRLPSMQVADGRRSPRLVVTKVGDAGEWDLGERSFAGNLNLTVSGDPDDPVCRNPALGGI